MSAHDIEHRVVTLADRPPGGRTDRRAAAETPSEHEFSMDEVHDASVESFPASDPPAWIAMRVGQPKRQPIGDT